jgi:hypothetical protein
MIYGLVACRYAFIELVSFATHSDHSEPLCLSQINWLIGYRKVDRFVYQITSKSGPEGLILEIYSFKSNGCM